LIELWTHYLEEVGSSPRPRNMFSIFLNEELNQMENKNNNKNSSNSLVFSRWPQTKKNIAWMWYNMIVAHPFDFIIQ